MTELFIILATLGTGFLLTIGNIVSLSRAQRRDNLYLKQHLASMDLYNREANKRAETYNREANARQEKWFQQQELWFKELGYTSRQIFERVDEPEDDDQNS